MVEIAWEQSLHLDCLQNFCWNLHGRFFNPAEFQNMSWILYGVVYMHLQERWPSHHSHFEGPHGLRVAVTTFVNSLTGLFSWLQIKFGRGIEGSNTNTKLHSLKGWSIWAVIPCRCDRNRHVHMQRRCIGKVDSISLCRKDSIWVLTPWSWMTGGSQMEGLDIQWVKVYFLLWGLYCSVQKYYFHAIHIFWIWYPSVFFSSVEDALETNFYVVSGYPFFWTWYPSLFSSSVEDALETNFYVVVIGCHRRAFLNVLCLSST
jgi:hypothetical protein